MQETSIPPADTPFDYDAWNLKRENNIKASKEAGHIHLDQVILAVETVRGKEIYCAHNHKERGVVRTVSNRGDVVVHWKDQYSANCNSASIRQDGKKSVFESWLMPTDLRDYVLADAIETYYIKSG